MVSKNKDSKIRKAGEWNQDEPASALIQEGIKLAETAPPEINLLALRKTIKGQVITPGDRGYDEARTLFYGGMDKRPALIVRAEDEADVSTIVSLARETGMVLAVRSGGHSNAGHSVCEGGIVLDLKEMRALEINVEERTAWVEPGLTTGEYSSAVGKFGLATGFGDTGSVGIGGITLGGGVGLLVRKYGLTIDSLLAAEVVTADGWLRRVDAETDPELFWAIRGGGGNFGVATRFKFRLHEVKTILGGMLILPATAEVIAGFVAAAEAAPEELSTIANIMPAPSMPFLSKEQHGKLVVMAMIVYAGDPVEGERAIAPLRKLAVPIADMLRPMRYAEMFPVEPGDYHPTAVGQTMFMERIDRDAAEKIVRFLETSDAAMRVAQLRVLGGAMARVPVEATAFAHRKARIMANLAAFYTSAEDRVVREEWVRTFKAALVQGNPGAYVNFLGDEGMERVKDAYPGKTWERLQAIKARYDPGNLFKLNQNVPPGGEGAQR